jgi:hypothetical protein
MGREWTAVDVATGTVDKRQQDIAVIKEVVETLLFTLTIEHQAIRRLTKGG